MIKGEIHLTLSEREQIESGMEEGISLGQMPVFLASQRARSCVRSESIRPRFSREPMGAFKLLPTSEKM